MCFWCLKVKLCYIDLFLLCNQMWFLSNIIFNAWRKPQAIDEKIRELSNCHLVYQGLDIPKAHSFPLFYLHPAYFCTWKIFCIWKKADLEKSINRGNLMQAFYLHCLLMLSQLTVYTGQVLTNYIIICIGCRRRLECHGGQCALRTFRVLVSSVIFCLFMQIGHQS